MKTIKNKCLYCLRDAPSENKVIVSLESSTGLDQEEHLLCNLHLIEYNRIKKKNAGVKF